MKSVNVNIAGEAYDKISKYCMDNDLKPSDVVSDALSLYFWAMEQLRERKKIYVKGQGLEKELIYLRQNPYKYSRSRCKEEYAKFLKRRAII